MQIKTGIAVCSFMIMSAGAQGPAPKTAPAKSEAAKAATSAAATAGVPKFKAIWEPVPFNKDIELHAIACVGRNLLGGGGQVHDPHDHQMGGKHGRCNSEAIPRRTMTP